MNQQMNLTEFFLNDSDNLTHLQESMFQQLACNFGCTIKDIFKVQYKICKL